MCLPVVKTDAAQSTASIKARLISGLKEDSAPGRKIAPFINVETADAGVGHSCDRRSTAISQKPVNQHVHRGVSQVSVNQSARRSRACVPSQREDSSTGSHPKFLLVAVILATMRCSSRRRYKRSEVGRRSHPSGRNGRRALPASGGSTPTSARARRYSTITAPITGAERLNSRSRCRKNFLAREPPE